MVQYRQTNSNWLKRYTKYRTIAMANICYNYLTIESEQTDSILNNVIDSNENVDFNLLLPMPQDVTLLTNPDTEEPYKGERDWSWTNVSCPGIPETTDIIKHSESETRVVFESQWGPPVKWFNELGRVVCESEIDKEKASVIELEYAEYDMEFAGTLTYTREPNGKEYYTQVKLEGEALAEALGHSDYNI